MTIYPAIDIKDGKCVRLRQGRFDDVTVFADEPWKMAVQWQEQGAQWLHVVDLDGARAGAPQNVAAVNELLRNASVPVQFGGGIRQVHTAELMFTLGVSRIVIGTAAAGNERLLKRFVADFGDRVAIGIDARDGFVSVEGWERDTAETSLGMARRVEALGARRIVYTDIASDGMLGGAPIASMSEMCAVIEAPVIASGGVGSLDDISRLQMLAAQGLEGVIVGRALYNGAFSLAEALREAQVGE